MANDRADVQSGNNWSGTAQRNYKDPKKRAAFIERADDRYDYRPYDETPENLLVGRNPIREALKSGRPIEKLLVMKGDLSGAAREIARMARESGIVVQEVDKARLDKTYPNHQGLLAYTSSAEYSTVEDIFAEAEKRNEPPFIVILDGVTDPHNLGAIIRSAECAGAHGVIIPERRSAGLNPACVKAAAGALEYMKVAKVGNLNRLIETLKERNIWVYAADMSGTNVYETKFDGAVALVVGGEGDGVSQLVMKNCDGAVKIPMSGHINSLNASVAAGILLFEIAKSRG